MLCNAQLFCLLVCTKLRAGARVLASAGAQSSGCNTVCTLAASVQHVKLEAEVVHASQYRTSRDFGLLFRGPTVYYGQGFRTLLQHAYYASVVTPELSSSSGCEATSDADAIGLTVSSMLQLSAIVTITFVMFRRIMSTEVVLG